MPPPGATIEVFRRATPRYDAVLHRGDGVRVALQGGSWNRIGGRPGRVPHDVAHFVVEEALGLDHGLWGVLCAGGLVVNASFVGGRLPPHARRRAAEVTAAAGEALAQAEVLVRAVADVDLAGGPRTAAALRAATGERWWPPSVGTAHVAAACAGLRSQAEHWESLAPGEPLVLRWPAGRHD